MRTLKEEKRTATAAVLGPLVQVCLWQQVMILDCLAGNEWRESSACAVWAIRLQQSVWNVCGTFTKLNFHPMHLRSILPTNSDKNHLGEPMMIKAGACLESLGSGWFRSTLPSEQNPEVDDLEGSMTRFSHQGMTRLDDYPLPQTTWQGWMTWRLKSGGWMRLGVLWSKPGNQISVQQHPRSNSGKSIASRIGLPHYGWGPGQMFFCDLEFETPSSNSGKSMFKGIP